jgi:glycosyltransferase involved in cell wall biosynthesis
MAFDKNQQLKVFIYCHEDKPHLFLTPQVMSKITDLLKQFPNRIQIASPSSGTNHNLATYLNLTLDDIQTLIYPILPLENDMDEDPLYETDQEVVRFCVVGSTADDRKNHSKVIDYFDEIIKFGRSDLRKFRVTFVGVGKDEKSKILSDEARKKLSSHYEEYGEVHQKDVIEILRTQDVLISISKYETLPKNVTEALMTGNLLIRNATSGMKEQLIEGKNGFLVDENKPGDIVSVILKILDPKEVSRAQIQEMKINSHLIALDLVNRSEIHSGKLLELLGSWLKSES